MQKEIKFSITAGIICLVAGIAVGWFMFSSPAPNLDKATTFKVADVYKDTMSDFEGGTLPVYDETFCKTKFSIRYQKVASSCLIKSITGFARANPLVKEVECSCYE